MKPDDDDHVYMTAKKREESVYETITMSVIWSAHYSFFITYLLVSIFFAHGKAIL